MKQSPTGAGAQPAPLTSAQKQARRVAELDAIAQAAGWPNWGKYSTAVKNRIVKIAAPPAPRRKRERKAKE